VSQLVLLSSSSASSMLSEPIMTTPSRYTRPRIRTSSSAATVWNKETTQSYMSGKSRLKHDLDDYDVAPERNQEWIDYQVVVIQNIMRLRASVKAPRDSWKDDFVPENRVFETLIGLRLSVFSRDESVVLSLNNLRKKGFLTVEAMNTASLQDIGDCIRGIIFHKTKAISIQKIAQQLVELFNSVVPQDFDKLQQLDGVGPKIAALTLLEGFGDDSFALYGIDSHMYDMFRTYFQFVNPGDITIKQIATTLCTWLPKKYWKELNRLFSGLGQLFSRLSPEQWDTMLFQKALAIGGPSFEAGIKHLSVLFLNEDKRVKELRRQENKRNPRSNKDLASQPYDGALWDELMDHGWTTSKKDCDVKYRSGEEGEEFNDTNPGIYNEDWFFDFDDIRTYLRGEKKRSRMRRDGDKKKKLSPSSLLFPLRQSKRQRGKSPSTTKAIIVADIKAIEIEAQEIVKRNFSSYFATLDINEGDIVGWYLHKNKSRKITTAYPVIKIMMIDGNDDDNDNDSSNSNGFIHIKYLGKHYKHAGDKDDVQSSKFRSYVSCTNSVNETYLQTYLKRIKNLKIFKDYPVEYKCEELYLAQIWNRVHHKEYHSKLAAGNNDRDNKYSNNNEINNSNQMEPIPSAYEQLRTQKIRRNEQRLIELGLYTRCSYR